MATLETAERRRKREAGDREALERGDCRSPCDNDTITHIEFVARGIAPHDIETFGPNQNVRTYRAWRALGRQVRKGERSVRLTVWHPIGKSEVDPDTGEPKPERCRPVSACVFHISQTDPVNGQGVAA